MAQTPAADLTALFISLFGPDELRRFLASHVELEHVVPSLPGLQASHEAVAFEAAHLLREHGAIDQALFEALLEARPQRVPEITHVARRFHVALDQVPGSELGARAVDVGLASESDRWASLLSRACCLVTSDQGSATGYLISATQIASSHAALGYPNVGEIVSVEFAELPRMDAQVYGHVTGEDIVVLTVAQPPAKREALRLARRCAAPAHGISYGYSRPELAWGTPIDQILVSPQSSHDVVGELVFRSEPLAAFLAEVDTCFAGAPVLVEGHVVGQVESLIGKVKVGVAVTGLLNACETRALLEILPQLTADDAVALQQLPQAANLTAMVGVGEIYVYVSRAPEDKEWTSALVARFEAGGLQCFVTDGERASLHQHLTGGATQRALTASRSAVIVHSAAWKSCGWCQIEATALIKRLDADPEYRVVVVQRDDAQMDAIWAARRCIEMMETPLPAGRAVDDLLHAVVWQAPRPPKSAAGMLEGVQGQAADRLMLEVRAASQVDAVRVFGVWEQWCKHDLPAHAAGLQAAEYLISQAKPDLALRILESLREGRRSIQLRALALAYMHRNDDAIVLLDRLRQSSELDAETLGLLAGRYKRRAEKTGKHHWLEKALRLYQDAFSRYGDTYTGINVASLALQLDQRDLSREMAKAVLALLRDEPESHLDHWQLATMGEALHLLGSIDEARRYYRRAVAERPGFDKAIATMRRQARRNSEAMGEPMHALDDEFPVPRVAAFVGHMVDTRERRESRFPARLVPKVRDAIRDRLQHWGVGYGFSSAARGSDILFVEELLRRSGHPKVILPFPAQDFELTSVGPAWSTRFRRVMEDLAVEGEVLRPTAPPEGDQRNAAYADCSLRCFQQAMDQASMLGDPPLLLTVWNGKAGDGRGGTADAVAHWRQEFGEETMDVIDPKRM